MWQLYWYVDNFFLSSYEYRTETMRSGATESSSRSPVLTGGAHGVGLLAAVGGGLRLALPLLLVAHAAALDNGVGRRPPLGYNTWNDLGPHLSSALLRSRVDAMVSSGLRDAGYVYFNLDDGWASDARGSDGRLSADPDKFPEGMRNFSDYVHAKGLKLGLYTDRGTKTCARKPGSYGYEKIDAQQYADWAVDYLKEDNCKAPGGPNNKTESLYRFSLMRDALNATGRPIFFSVCGGGDQLPWNDLSYFAKPPFGSAVANSWRVSPDATGFLSTLHALNINGKLAEFAGAGGFNDPDMLLASTRGAARSLGPHQSRTMFGIWAVLAAPLLIGGPVSKLDAWDLETYTNGEVIAVNQDPLVAQGGEIAPGVWARELADGGVALVMANRGVSPANVTCDAACWQKTPFKIGTRLSLRDLWAHAPPKEPALANGLVVPEPLTLELRGYWDDSRAFKASAA